MQTTINTLGSIAATAIATGDKVRYIMTLPFENIGAVASTFVAQNYGVKRMDHIRLGIRTAVLIQIGIDFNLLS